jgi:hypothetical protein
MNELLPDPLGPTKLKILEFVLEYQLEHGHGPTKEEIIAWVTAEMPHATS